LDIQVWSEAQSVRIKKPGKEIGNEVLVSGDKVDLHGDESVNGEIDSTKQDRVVYTLCTKRREHVYTICVVRVNSDMITRVFGAQVKA